METADEEKELRFHELWRSATDNFEPVVLKVKDLVKKIDDLSVEARSIKMKNKDREGISIFDEFLHDDQENVTESETEDSGPHMTPAERLRAELDLENHLKLTSLMPSDVTQFLVSFEHWEQVLHAGLGTQRAYLQRCIDPDLLTEMAEVEGVNTKKRSQILKYLKRLTREDQNARRTLLLERVKTDVTWENCGNITSSMRNFLSKGTKLLRGIKMDTYTDKMFCQRVISNLPKEFRRGAPKATQEHKNWKSWKSMCKALKQEAAVLSWYTMDSEQLRIQVKNGENKAKKKEPK